MREYLKLTITILLPYFHYTNSFYRKQVFIEMDLISSALRGNKNSLLWRFIIFQ